MFKFRVDNANGDKSIIRATAKNIVIVRVIAVKIYTLKKMIIKKIIPFFGGGGEAENFHK